MSKFVTIAFAAVVLAGCATTPVEEIKPTPTKKSTSTLPVVYAQPDKSNLIRTDRELDFAIDGPGYFEVRLPDAGTAYTKKGRFIVNGQGILATEEGYELIPSVSVPYDSAKVATDSLGLILATSLTEQSVPQEIGRFVLNRFPVEAQLKPAGPGLFTAEISPVTDFPGEGFGFIRQGYLEAQFFIGQTLAVTLEGSPAIANVFKAKGVSQRLKTTVIGISADGRLMVEGRSEGGQGQEALTIQLTGEAIATETNSGQISSNQLCNFRVKISSR